MPGNTLFFVYPGDLDTPTGGYRYDRRLIRELKALGLPVQAVSLPGEYPFVSDLARSEADNLFSDFPDGATVIVDGLAFGVLDVIALREQARLRLVALCHHPLALEAGLDESQQKSLRASEYQALAAARAVLVTSPATARLLVEQFDLPESKITVAVPGTDEYAFAPCTGEPPVLLTAASLTRRKAHDVLIEALSELVDLPWLARFVGGDHFDPPWTALLHRQVIASGLEGRITFLTAVDDLEPEYSEADIFVLPSRFEGYGMVFSEALSAGLPVVAARAGAVPEVVPHTAGLLVPPDDPGALASTLRQLLENPALRRDLQAGARQAAACLTRWPDTARRVAELVSEVQGA